MAHWNGIENDPLTIGLHSNIYWTQNHSQSTEADLEVQLMEIDIKPGLGNHPSPPQAGCACADIAAFNLTQAN